MRPLLMALLNNRLGCVVAVLEIRSKRSSG
jgi:hypothetical protein